MLDVLQKPLSLIPYTSIMEEPLPQIPWLVEPLIAVGDRTVLYGAWGSYKSWILTHLGLHLAAGKDWMGQFPISEPKSVLYVDEEMNEVTFRRRLKQLGLGAGLDGSDQVPFQLLSRHGIRFDSKGAKNLLHGLETVQFQPQVVIFETLRAGLVGNENEAMEIRRFWQNVEPILQSGMTLIISHHMKKPSQQGGNSTRNQASGSTDIMAGADSAIAVVGQKKSHGVVLVQQVKNRATEEHKPFSIQLDIEGDDGPARLIYLASTSAAKAAATELEKGVALCEEYFKDKGTEIIKTKDVIGFLTDKKMKGRTAEEAFKVYKRTGAVISIKKGHWQNKPPKDLAA